MRNIVLFFLFICVSLSCRNVHTPKPKGHLRIDLPESQYIPFDRKDLPYGFNISTNTIVEIPPNDSSLYWLNIDYPNLHAKIYCSFQTITLQSLPEHENECRRLMERTVRNADAINEKRYENREQQVYGTLFRIEGETASPVQFMLTDSASVFFRGSLYFKYGTNADSPAPVTAYIENAITELIQSLYWKTECLY